MTIRACGPRDAFALSLLGQATFLESYADTVPSADILAHCAEQNSQALFSRWLSRPDYRFWLAEVSDTGAPVGFAMLCPPDLPVPTGPQDVELKRLYILHRFHGGGTGAALTRAAMAAGAQAGFTRLLLGVYARNDKARGFYARLGFDPIGARQMRVGDNDYDDIVLARPLGEADRDGPTR